MDSGVEEAARGGDVGVVGEEGVEQLHEGKTGGEEDLGDVDAAVSEVGEVEGCAEEVHGCAVEFEEVLRVFFCAGLIE